MDRRTFLGHSAVLAAGALVSSAIPINASTEKAYGIGDSCPRTFASDPSAVVMIDKLIHKGGYKPSEIAFCSMEFADVNTVASRLFGSHENWPPYFRTLHSICYRDLIKNKDWTLRMMGSGDYVGFLAAMPDYHVADEKICQHKEKRLNCSSREELRHVERLIDPTQPYFSGPNRDEVDCYAVYRIENQIVDQTDLLVKGLLTEDAVQGVEIAIFQGNNPPLWDAAAKNLFKNVPQRIFLRKDL